MGLTENTAAFIVSYYYKDLIAFLILVIILLFKPSGLFVRGKTLRRI
jgi:branched-subunit amino acid ABC-type transport system permease component